MKIDPRPAVSKRAKRYDAGAFGAHQGRPKLEGELEMSEMISSELRFIPACIPRQGRRHYPGIVDQDVELFVVSKELFREGVY